MAERWLVERKERDGRTLGPTDHPALFITPAEPSLHPVGLQRCGDCATVRNNGTHDRAHRTTPWYLVGDKQECGLAQCYLSNAMIGCSDFTRRI